MHYKTIVLELLEGRPRLRERLQKYRQLLPTLEFYAGELKTGHEAWKERLASPTSDPAQIASEAMERAVAELESRLPKESNEGGETLSLDEAMAFLKKRSSDG
jgi:hypothetical protein